MYESTPLSFAIIGCSDIAPSHITCLRKIPRVAVTHVYSRSHERANAFANRFDLIPCCDAGEIFGNSEIDAVVIATDPERHATYGCEAIRSKKHVLIEKPLALNLDDGQRLVNLAKTSDVTTSVVSQYRYDDTVINVAKQLKAGKLGALYLVKGSLAWLRDHDYFSKGNGWRGNEADVLTNQGIHLLDIILLFFGEPKSSAITFSNVNSSVSTYDNAILTMKFDKELIGILTCTTASPIHQRTELSIHGTEGIAIIRSRGDGFVSECVGSGIPEYFRQLTKRSYLRLKKRPLQRQMEDFVCAIREKRAPLVSLEDGQKALRVILQSDRVT